MERRPRGRPKTEPSAVVNVRLPHSLLTRLDRFLDLAEHHVGIRSNRNEAIRKALTAWLDEREQTLSISPPRAPTTATDRASFIAAYNAVGNGGDFVRIHAIREQLGWPSERFNQILETLRSGYVIVLHGGDPSRMTSQEIKDSYTDQYGTLYLTMSLAKN